MAVDVTQIQPNPVTLSTIFHSENAAFQHIKSKMIQSKDTCVCD